MQRMNMAVSARTINSTQSSSLRGETAPRPFRKLCSLPVLHVLASITLGQHLETFTKQEALV
jgi:hypothetical protein